MPIIYSFNESRRDILPTISVGSITLTGEQDPAQLHQLINCNVSGHIGSTSTDKALLDASLPVSDMWNAIKPSSGVAAEDEIPPLLPEHDDEDENENIEDV